MNTVKLFGKIKWTTTFHLATERLLIYRCYDYAENKEGKKHAMFYADGVVRFEEGKIKRHEWGVNADQAAIFAELMAP